MINRTSRLAAVATAVAACALPMQGVATAAPDPQPTAAPDPQPAAAPSQPTAAPDPQPAAAPSQPTAVPEPPSRVPWADAYFRWPDDGDAGGVSIGDEIDLYNNRNVWGNFQADGEHLYVFDHYPNEHKTMVRLWVGGSSPKVYYSESYDNVRDVDLTYDEGQTVYLQVCTSDSPNAACSDKETYKGVT